MHAFFNCMALNVCSSAFILCFIPIFPEFLCALFPSFWFLAFLYYVFSCMAFFLYYSSFTVSHTSKHFKLLVAHIRTYMRNRLDQFTTLLKIDPVMIMKSSNAEMRILHDKTAVQFPSRTYIHAKKITVQTFDFPAITKRFSHNHCIM